LLKGRKHHIIEILLGISVSAWSRALKSPGPATIIANKVAYRKETVHVHASGDIRFIPSPLRIWNSSPFRRRY